MLFDQLDEGALHALACGEGALLDRCEGLVDVLRLLERHPWERFVFREGDAQPVLLAGFECTGVAAMEFAGLDDHHHARVHVVGFVLDDPVKLAVDDVMDFILADVNIRFECVIKCFEKP